MKLIKKISIGIIFLLIIGMFSTIYEASSYPRRSSTNWEERSLPDDFAIDIAVGNNGEVYCVGEVGLLGGHVYRWDESNQVWDDSIEGALYRITVDDKGFLWGMNVNGDMYYFDNGWIQVQRIGLPVGGKFWDIAIAGNPDDPKLYIIAPALGIKTGGYVYEYYKVGQHYEWRKFSDLLLTRIAISENGELYAINGFTHKTYSWDDSYKKWKEIPKGYVWYDVAVSDTYLYMLGYYRHWRYGATVMRTPTDNNPSTWEAAPPPDAFPYNLATNIDTGSNGDIWTVNDQGRIFKYIKTDPPSKEWKVGKTYKIGDIVTYNNNLYECIQAHIVYAPNWTPPNTPALWKPL